MGEGEQQTVPFEFKTNYASPDHVYTALEALETIHQNPAAIFVYLFVFDKSINGHITEGVDYPGMGDEVKKVLQVFIEKYPMIQFSAAIPVLCDKTDDSGMKVAYLAAIPLASIKNTDSMYLEDYYEDFETNPSNNKKLSDSLPTYLGSESFSRMKDSDRQYRVALLGNSYSGNYAAVVDSLDNAGVNSMITVMDYNRIPLINTRNTEGIRPQDNLVQADITRMPITRDKTFNVMFGDFILSCFHPEKIDDFFTSVSDHLSGEGVLFLSLSCNNRAKNREIVELSDVFDFTVRDLKGKVQEQYFRATLSFYEALGARHGLKFDVIKEQVREEYADVCDYYLAVHKT